MTGIKQADRLNREGISYANNGDIENAEKVFRHVVSRFPEEPDAYTNLGNIMSRKGVYSQAIEYHKISLKLSIKPYAILNAHHNLANTYLETRQYRAALDCFAKALNIDENSWESLHGKGLCHYCLGEWQEAGKLLQKAYSINRDIKIRQLLDSSQKRNHQDARVKDILSRASEDRSSVIIQGNGTMPSRDNRDLFEGLLDNSERIAFFVGAGISLPAPSNLPLAGSIIDHITDVLIEIDEGSLRRILEQADLHGESFKESVSDFIGHSYFPFEPTFQALMEICGNCVLTFSDYLNARNSDMRIEPNINHFMLAHAIRRGHVVVTTNFDELIEAAYEKLFPDEELVVLVTDKQFQDAYDHSVSVDAKGGILLKIHGTASDYNSLAITTNALASTSDKTMNVGFEIDAVKAKAQSEEVYMSGTLSIPRSLMMQSLIETCPFVFLGYSGSDIFDITPIIGNASPLQGKGVWVSHFTSGRDELDRVEKIWANHENSRRNIVEDTTAVANYILKRWNLEWPQEFEKLVQQVENRAVADFWKKVEGWIGRLNLKRGDGLSFFALLAFEIGNWKSCIELCNEAIRVYETDLSRNDYSWLRALSLCSSAYANNQQNDKAVRLLERQREFITAQSEPRLYESTYCRMLLDFAFEWIDTDKKRIAEKYIEEVLGIVHGDFGKIQIKAYALRILGFSAVKDESYMAAIEYFREALAIHFDITGNARGQIEDAMHLAECCLKLNDLNKAQYFLQLAENTAKALGDPRYLEIIKQNRAAAFQSFHGLSKTSVIHQEMIDEARVGLGPRGLAKYEEMQDILNSKIHALQYSTAHEMIEEMIELFPSSRKFMRFLETNLAHRLGNYSKEIELLERWIEDYGDSIIASANLGLAYLYTGRMDEAQDRLEQANQSYVERFGSVYPLTLENLVTVYLNKEDIDKAQHCFSELKKDSDVSKAILERVETVLDRYG